MDMILTRQERERERLVLDLYYNENKNTRQIAKEVRMNFGDIDAIINKAKEENEACKE
jgi:DNA-directed RNA polymerase specialized sigma subunit